MPQPPKNTFREESFGDKVRRAANDPSAGREERPPGVRPGKRPSLRVMTTTLWEYPSQHYDGRESNFQGSKDYAGATPSWVIWQLLQRYTRPGDTVLDPMCGSGTTLDVCKDLDRTGIGFDLNPQRPDITRADARQLPTADQSIDFCFVDPPYSTHINYSDDPECIGRLDAGAPMRGDDVITGQAYYEAMEETIAEIDRVLRPNRYMGLYVSDSWRKEKGVKGGVFMPIGFELFSIMRDYFRPVDIIAVARGNTKLQRGNWHKSAEEENFYLRGFNYLFVMKKEDSR